MVGYVTADWLLSVAYTKPGRQAVSVIFEKFPFAISLHVSFCPEQPFIVLDVLIRSTVAYLCSNMTNFDTVDIQYYYSEDFL